MARRAGERCPGEHAHREDEQVLRPERVRAFWQLGEKVRRDERAATRMLAEGRLVDLLDGRRASGEAAAQYLAPPAAALARATLIILKRTGARTTWGGPFRAAPARRRPATG